MSNKTEPVTETKALVTKSNNMCHPPIFPHNLWNNKPNIMCHAPATIFYYDFWFNKPTGLALPWVMIPEDVDYKINVKFRSITELQNDEHVE